MLERVRDAGVGKGINTKRGFSKRQNEKESRKKDLEL